MFCKHVLMLILLFLQNQRVGWLLFVVRHRIKFVAQKEKKGGRMRTFCLHSRVASLRGGFVGALSFGFWVRSFEEVGKRLGEKSKKKSKKQKNFQIAIFNAF